MAVRDHLVAAVTVQERRHARRARPFVEPPRERGAVGRERRAHGAQERVRTPERVLDRVHEPGPAVAPGHHGVDERPLVHGRAPREVEREGRHGRNVAPRERNERRGVETAAQHGADLRTRLARPEPRDDGRFQPLAHRLARMAHRMGVGRGRQNEVVVARHPKRVVARAKRARRAGRKTSNAAKCGRSVAVGAAGQKERHLVLVHVRQARKEPQQGGQRRGTDEAGGRCRVEEGLHAEPVAQAQHLAALLVPRDDGEVAFETVRGLRAPAPDGVRDQNEIGGVLRHVQPFGEKVRLVQAHVAGRHHASDTSGRGGPERAPPALQHGGEPAGGRHGRRFKRPHGHDPDAVGSSGPRGTRRSPGEGTSGPSSRMVAWRSRSCAPPSSTCPSARSQACARRSVPVPPPASP